MKISFTKNFEQLDNVEVANIINSSEIIPVVMIPILCHTNKDLMFDSNDIFFVHRDMLKQLYSKTNLDEFVYKSLISPYNDVILADEDEAMKIWHSCSMYDEREKYKSMKDALSVSMIFKVLSNKDVEKLQEMMIEEKRSLLSSIKDTKDYLNSIDK